MCTTCRPSQPLDGFTVVIVGKLSKTTAVLTKTIGGLGGSVVKDVDSSTNLCISSKGVCVCACSVCVCVLVMCDILKKYRFRDNFVDIVIVSIFDTSKW